MTASLAASARVATALVILIAVASAAASAQVPDDPLTSEERALAERGPLRVAIHAEPPAGVVENGAVAGGWGTELVELAALKVGVDVEFVPAPSAAQTVALLTQRSVDLAGPLAARPDLAAFGPTSPFSWTPIMFVTHDGHDELRSHEELAGMRVSTIAGSRAEAWLLENLPDVVYVPTSSVAEGVAQLAAREIDAYLGPLGLIGHQIQQSGHRNVRPLGDPVELNTIHFWGEPGSLALSILEKGRERITEQEMGLIHVKWTGFDLGPPTEPAGFALPLWGKLAAGAIGGLVVVLGAGTVVLRREVANRTRALARERSFLAAVLDTDPNPVYVKDAEGRYALANQAWARLMDRRLADLLGRTDAELGLDPAFAARSRAEEEKVRRDKRPLLVPERAFRDPASGEERWFSVGLTPVEQDARASPEVLGVWVDVTDARRLRQGLQVEVAQRTAELHRTIEDLEAFARTASHDLRAPLRTIATYADVLLEEKASSLDADARAHLQSMQEAARRMSELLDALLELSRATSTAPIARDVDMSAIAHRVRGELEAQDPDRRVRWEIEPGLRATGDPKLLAIALTNLLANAWKYTSKRSDAAISFSARHDGRRTVFEVRDNGAGFDPARAGRLWEPFHRLHPDSEFAGTGIGLATVKRIVQRHGGVVSAEGQLDKGAAFRFALPDVPDAASR